MGVGLKEGEKREENREQNHSKGIVSKKLATYCNECFCSSPGEDRAHTDKHFLGCEC